MRKRSAAVARGQEVGGRTRPKESQVQKQLEGMGKRGASKLSKLKRAEVHRAIREHAMSVEANDDDGDWSLTFSEFKRLVEHRLPKLSFGRKTLLAWHKSLDPKGRGTIGLDLYFAFAVREALLRIEYMFPARGAPATQRRGWFELVFGKPELEDSEDELMDREEFTRFAEKIGFGSAASNLFDTIASGWRDDDSNRSVSVVDPEDKVERLDPNVMLSVVGSRTSGVRPLLQAWAKNAAASGSERLDGKTAPHPPPGTRGGGGGDDSGMDAEHGNEDVRMMDWATRRALMEVEGNVPELMRRLRSWLRGDGSARAVEVTISTFKRLDADGSMEISERELKLGLAALGYEGPPELIEAMFDVLDEDATYKIGFSEFKAWLMASERSNSLDLALSDVARRRKEATAE